MGPCEVFVGWHGTRSCIQPLSEGRIPESGELQCTSHGWRWDAKGSCTSIPQMPDPKAHAVACASPRSCVKDYPTQVGARVHAVRVWERAPACTCKCVASV